MVTIDDFKNEIDKYPVKHYQMDRYDDRTWFIDAEVPTCYATKIDFQWGKCFITLADHLEINPDTNDGYRIWYCLSRNYPVTDDGFKSFKIHLKELYNQYKEFSKKIKEHKIKKKLSIIEKDFV